jgi:hypothetical protein
MLEESSLHFRLHHKPWKFLHIPHVIIPDYLGNGTVHLECINCLIYETRVYCHQLKMNIDVATIHVGSHLKFRKDNISSLAAKYPDGGFM